MLLKLSANIINISNAKSMNIQPMITTHGNKYQDVINSIRLPKIPNTGIFFIPEIIINANDTPNRMKITTAPSVPEKHTVVESVTIKIPL